MTLEEFATLARAIQSILTPLAILIAAGWAIYTFRALGQVTQSRAQLQKTEAEILDLQREAKIGAVVEMSIKTSQHTRPNDPYTYVSAIVEIENKGSRNTRLEHGEDRRPFLVFSVDFEDDGSLKYERQAAYPVPVGRAPNNKSPSTIVRAGGREKLPFYFRVSLPGAYLLVFTAPTSEKEQAIGRELGLNFPRNWVVKEYLVIERPGGHLEGGIERVPAVHETTKDRDPIIRAELPDVKPEHVDISLHENVLTISGEPKVEQEEERGGYHMREQRYGSLSYSFLLPEGTDESKIRAFYENGILEVTVEGADEVQEPKRIQIEGSSS